MLRTLNITKSILLKTFSSHILSQLPSVSPASSSALLRLYSSSQTNMMKQRGVNFQRDFSKTIDHSKGQAPVGVIEAPLESPFRLLDLDPLPLEEAQTQFNSVLRLFSEDELKRAVKIVPALDIIYKRIHTSIFHLNLAPKIDESNRPHYTHISNRYPYDPVYKAPFPKKPTLETMSDIGRILAMVAQEKALPLSAVTREQVKGTSQALINYVRDNQMEPATALDEDQPTVAVSKAMIIKQPVDAYLQMQARLTAKGELASFPEFKESVIACLKALRSKKIRQLCESQPLLVAEVDAATQALKEVCQPKGGASGAHPAFEAPFPYRRTFLAIKQAVTVCDMVERLIYPGADDWHEVEESWYKKDATKKLLPLYHVNRYSYQEYGLLSNPNVVLLPWIGHVSMEDLVILRASPFCLVGVIFDTLRIDRHHNSPLDFFVHDINHGRRLLGYFIRRLQTEIGMDFMDKPKAVEKAMRCSEAYLSELIKQTDPNEKELTTHEKWIRSIQRYVIFETFHETALDGTRESLLNDLYRLPNTPQPFEVLLLKPVSRKKEELRTFDGNLKSGADNLELDLSAAIEVTYFFDRASGFLANVFNKLVCGFYQSVFVDKHSQEYIKHMTANNLAEAVIGLFKLSGVRSEEIPSKAVLIEQIADMSGQTELRDYYFSLAQEQCNALLSRSKPQIKQARNLKKMHPDLSPAAVAKSIHVTEYQKELLQWMLKDLKNYDENFDQFFSEKMSRTKRKEFHNAEDFSDKFVGPGKLFLSSVAPQDALKANKPGTLYIDTWSVSFFNSAVQTPKAAHQGLKKTIRIFEEEDLEAPTLSLHRFSELVALFGRPEFDDVRRYKLKLFPSPVDMVRFGRERNDAKTISDRFPEEFCIITNENLGLDQLSFTFGQHVHFVGLISHSESRKADERHFVGTSDFLEHDFAHGYFSIELPVPGSSADWVDIHHNFIQRQVREIDEKAKLMNSIVYFYFTHESGYKSMIPDLAGKEPLPNAYLDDLAIIKQRIEYLNDLDFVKSAFPEFQDESIRNHYLEKAFHKIAPPLKDHIDRLRKEEAALLVEHDSSNFIF